jgi:hypothetical protein
MGTEWVKDSLSHDLHDLCCQRVRSVPAVYVRHHCDGDIALRHEQQLGRGPILPAAVRDDTFAVRFSDENADAIVRAVAETEAWRCERF